ncbi:energy-coupling factor ABC transporter ATP-binding protein [Weissella diestrammenae]|uniref:Energy-coupling factor ABC transporter ATP-binding protein n=1 Tax=Weissella diestrammenae TaxID=1162633 RepID=A0A7G9T3I3_9LACO|nr:energy-coupling factor ABC transporter ATP-binding protein [Weissella diestrammenae]MCM0582629.1 energy-coupling factor ABC transporter ATP-binding protein [Weissella diestrammenae]QNN74658.1 energy-coupling factor ABC transporter ATP-binding protein [Weissella diestrammenae]
MATMIELKNVSYTYPEAETPALQDLSLTIDAGEWVAVIGHNGSGKSTLAKLLNYLLQPSAGEIRINGILAEPVNVWTIRDLVGMVFQNPDNQFVGATVADDVAFGLENRGIARDVMQQKVEQALRRVHMWKFAAREPARLSGGQKQRVAIASALVLAPQVLILDEATSMLDPKGRREMVQLVRELKQELGSALTVISITHDIEEAASANRVIVINDGSLIETGVPSVVFSDAKRLQSFGLDVPFAEQLKAKLAAKGVDVPDDYQTTEGMVNWIWQSISPK